MLSFGAEGNDVPSAHTLNVLAQCVQHVYTPIIYAAGCSNRAVSMFELFRFTCSHDSGLTVQIHRITQGTITIMRMAKTHKNK